MTFLSDGADDVRELPLYLSSESEHWLDWFHVAMRLRVMGQMAKGLVNEQNMASAQEPLTEAGEELDSVDISKQLERVKWFLWHGNVVQALDTIEDIEDELDLLGGVDCGPAGGLANGEEAAYALDQTRCADIAPRALCATQRRPISVGDYLYEVSFPDPLAVPRGHILQVAAKQQCDFNTRMGSRDAHHEDLRKIGSHARRALLI